LTKPPPHPTPQPIPNPARSGPGHPPEFSHPTEELFARILDFYGIEWQYEPSTFPLEWDAQGTVIEAFSPDFYLPAQDLYIELTTLRPQLSTYKNRRLRRMRELYPNIQVKLLKRRELHAMLLKYGLSEDAAKIAGTDSQSIKGANDHN
jgi:hypoxanthine phosphoribosyltransferase